MLRRFLILLTALTLLATACGGDDSSDDAGGDSGDQSSDSDSSGSDSGDDDAGGSDDSPSGTPASFDCDDIRDAIDAAGDSVDLDPSASPDDLEASFNNSRAQLQALADEAPELSDDVDAALAGMDVIGDALAALDWDTANLATNPEAALEFASLISDPAFMGMTEALTNISTWVASACA